MKGYVLIFCAVISALAEENREDRVLTVIPCRRNDRKCLLESAEKLLPVLAAGVPQFNIETMDPMHMKRVKAKQVGLDMDFRNTIVTGLRHCNVLNLKRADTKTFLDLKCSVNLKGDYTLGGELFIMPINGSGKYEIKIRDIVVKIMFVVGDRTVNNEKYWVVENWTHSYNVEKGAHFQFNNLFNGNKILADEVHRFANEYWSEIIKYVGPPIVKTIVEQVLHEVSKLFDHVPIKDMVIE